MPNEYNRGHEFWLTFFLSSGQASAQVESLARDVPPLLLATIDEEDSKQAVAHAVTTLSKYLLTGACRTGSWQEATGAVSKILLGQAICQATNSEAEEWEDEEEDEKEVRNLIFIETDFHLC